MQFTSTVTKHAHNYGMVVNELKRDPARIAVKNLHKGLASSVEVIGGTLLRRHDSGTEGLTDTALTSTTDSPTNAGDAEILRCHSFSVFFG